MSKPTIKFTHAQEGEVEYCNGHTVYSDLFMLGAFALTSRGEFKKNYYDYQFATDAEGLKELISKSNETLPALQRAIGALGLVMTDEQSEFVNENRNQLNWLVVGLSEISTMVTDNLYEMNMALRLLKEKGGRDNVENQ